MTKFEVGHSYGNDLTIEVIKRTKKTITIKSVFGTTRVKIREYYQGVESIDFKAWLIAATEIFNADKALEIALDKAYHS